MGKWQVNYKDGKGWEDVSTDRAERIIKETYSPADDIIQHAKDTGEEVNTVFAVYRWVDYPEGDFSKGITGKAERGYYDKLPPF